MRKTLQRENYHRLQDIPEKYDDYYVYGISAIESDFPIDGALDILAVEGNEIDEENFLGICTEIVLSEETRNEMVDDFTLEGHLYIESRYPYVSAVNEEGDSIRQKEGISEQDGGLDNVFKRRERDEDEI